jgi:hypothetical protein
MKRKVTKLGFPVLLLILGVVIGIFMYPASSFAKNELYQKNKNGLTYGTLEAVAKNPLAETPDLIACEGIDGTIGYCYRADLDGDQPSNPEEAIKYMEELNKQIAIAIKNGEVFLRYIPLYDSDGKTVIGKFGISIPYESIPG